MEQVHGTHKASKFEPQDFISGMPDNVITNILDRLPIKDAVKTDVLSKYWKFKWTLLTSLIFDEDFCLSVPEEANIYDGKIINRLLHHLKGPITKFVLNIPFAYDDVTFDCEDINHWVMLLSRRGIKEITLQNMSGYLLDDLSTNLYSCKELKHLDLSNVFLPLLCGFHGFPNLLSLHLNFVHFSTNSTFGMFIARCPLLEILSNSDADNRCEPGLIEISKLGNLKKLSWSVCRGEAEPQNMIRSSSLYQLPALLKLQELKLKFGCGKFLAEAGFDKKVPAAFLCLKTLILCDVNLGCDIAASFVMKLICNSPNLQCLYIKRKYNNDVSPSAVGSLDLGWNTMNQLQLRSVVFSQFRGLENEVRLIKLILACSPLLKEIVIYVDRYFVMNHAEYKRLDLALEMARKLLKLHRASPIVDIDFC